MSTNPEIKPDAITDSVDLDGLDNLLDEAHVEVVDRSGVIQDPEAPAFYETKTMLELLRQVQEVHQLLSETNNRLTKAYSRLRHMEKVVEDQERKLTLLPHFQEQADRAVRLQCQLDEAMKEIEMLRQPWWHKLAGEKKEQQ